MYIQIRRYELKSGNVQDVMKQAEQTLAPVLRKIPGFVDYLGVDSQDGKVFSVTLCRDKASLEEVKKKALEWNRQFASAALPGAPEIIEGEVSFEASLDQKLLKSAA